MFLAIIVALSVALIAVCIDAYAGGEDEKRDPQRDTPEELKCEKASVTTASGSLVDRKAFCSRVILSSRTTLTGWTWKGGSTSTPLEEVV